MCMYVSTCVCMLRMSGQNKTSKRVSLALDHCTGVFREPFPLSVLPKSLFSSENRPRRLPASKGLKYIAKVTSLPLLASAWSSWITVFSPTPAAESWFDQKWRVVLQDPFHCAPPSTAAVTAAVAGYFFFLGYNSIKLKFRRVSVMFAFHL